MVGAVEAVVGGDRDRGDPVEDVAGLADEAGIDLVEVPLVEVTLVAPVVALGPAVLAIDQQRAALPPPSAIVAVFSISAGSGKGKGVENWWQT